jgi:hypothetical protein
MRRWRGQFAGVWDGAVGGCGQGRQWARSVGRKNLVRRVGIDGQKTLGVCFCLGRVVRLGQDMEEK